MARRARRAAVAAAVAVLAAAAVQQPALAQQPGLAFNFVASPVISGQSPPAYGVNVGHSNDPSFLTWMQRLGVNGARIFGLAGNLPNSGLQGFITTATPGVSQAGVWGSDLNNSPVTNLATFTAAVNLLRTPAGHTPAQAGTFPNPAKFAAFELGLNTTNTGAPDGRDMNSLVQMLQGANIEPLLVFWMGCGTFQFTNLDMTTQIYWADRWELYKHQYMAARWAYVRGVRKLEFWNEPDLNSQCITKYSWMEHYTLQSTAIQNAFADLNNDVANGVIACAPATPGGCPLQPIIFASAFAQATFSGTSTQSTYTPLPYTTYGDDGYIYMQQPSVANEHLTFPPHLGGHFAGGVDVPSQQNMMALSAHSYGKTGYGLSALGTSTSASMAAARTPPIPASLPVLPFAVTEHAGHTTATWNSLATTGDTPFEASRLGAQVLFQVMNGFESYIFKFSTLEQSNAITSGCKKNATASGVGTPCGIQKTGLHWGENAFAPFQIGDSTLMAEAAGLIIRASAGNKNLETLTPAAGTQGGAVPPSVYATALGSPKFPGYMIPPMTVVNDGRRRTLLFVNEGYNPTDSATYNMLVSYPATYSFNIASWGVAPGTTLVHTIVADGYFGEVFQYIQAPANGQLTIQVPAYSTSSITAPVVAQQENVMFTTDDCTVAGGSAANVNLGGQGTILSVGTSVTSDHSSTKVALMKFDLSSTNPTGLLTAVLELTVASPPANDMIMTIVGANPASGTWSENTVTWNGVSWILNPAVGVITSVFQNFQRTDLGLIVGHVTVKANTPAGTIKRIDVTDYVRSVGAAQATFSIARRLRNSAGVGNAAGPVPGDTLSMGASVGFNSGEASTGQPVLRIMSTQASVPTAYQISFSAASTAAGRRRLLASGDPVLTDGGATIAKVESALSAAAGGPATATALTGYMVTAQIQMTDVSGQQWTAAVQRAFEDGMALDCGVAAINVQLANYLPGSTPRTIMVPVAVSGFAEGNDAGLSDALSCVTALRSVVKTSRSNVYKKLADLGLRGAIASVSAPLVHRMMTSVVTPAGSDPARAARSLDNAVGSGTFENELNKRGVKEMASRADKFSSDACRTSTSTPPAPVKKAAPTPSPKKSSG